MADQFENNYATQLNGAINDSVTTLTVDTAPTTMTGAFRIKIESEIILVGAVSGLTYTGCTRGVEGTVAASHSDNTVVTHVLTAQALRNTGPVSFIGCSVTGTSTALNNGSYTSMAFGSADTYDTDGFHDPSTNNTRLTIPTGLGGKYLLTITIQYPNSSSTNDRRVAYRITAGSEDIIARSYYALNGVSEYVSGSRVIEVVGGDYVEVRGFVDASGQTSAYVKAELTKIGSGGLSIAPGVRVSNTAGSTLNNNSETPMPFASEEYDTDLFHDNSTNNSRLTIPAGLAGRYAIEGGFTMTTSNIGNAYAAIKKNGTTYLTYVGRMTGDANGATGYNPSTIVDLLVGDYIELVIYQSSGSSKTLETAVGFNHLSMSLLNSGVIPVGLTQPRQFTNAVVVATPATLTWDNAPQQASVLFAVIATTATARNVSSITQTNVTWTSLHTKTGTDVTTELWKGVPSGVPGTTTTVNLAAGATNADVAALEWPDITIAGTLDQSADNNGASGANANIAVNSITPTTTNNVAFCLFCVGNGTIPINFAGNFNRFGPVTPNFAAFGWIATGKIPLYANIPVQTSAAWCNFLASVK